MKRTMCLSCAFWRISFLRIRLCAMRNALQIQSFPLYRRKRMCLLSVDCVIHVLHRRRVATSSRRLLANERRHNRFVKCFAAGAPEKRCRGTHIEALRVVQKQGQEDPIKTNIVCVHCKLFLLNASRDQISRKSSMECKSKLCF